MSEQPIHQDKKQKSNDNSPIKATIVTNDDVNKEWKL